MVKISTRISPDDMNGLEKKKYAALIAKDTSKTDNTSANRNFERCVYAGIIAKKSVIGKSAANAVKETVRTTWAKKDSDRDGAPDINDPFPRDPTEKKDTDNDGKGDNSDPFPNDPNETSDNDGDGKGDNADSDDDNDDVPDSDDDFPEDPNETNDNDSDGIGDNADPDDDNDGIPDSDDDMPEDPNSYKDRDGDGVGDENDDFPDNPYESVKVAVISFDQTTKFQTISIDTVGRTVEYRLLYLSTNDTTLATPEQSTSIKKEENGSQTTIVQYRFASAGKVGALIGKNLLALFPGDWIQYLYEPIKTWNGTGNNSLSQDFTTFYDIIQFQQTYNGIPPHKWIKYVANDTERRADEALGGAQSTDGPNIYFNVVTVNNVERLPGGREDGNFNADTIRYYTSNRHYNSWFSIRSHYPVIQNRGVIGYGLSVMSQLRQSKVTPSTIGMQYAPNQEVSLGSATIHFNGARVVPGGSTGGPMPRDLYDHIYYRAYLNGINNYNYNTSNSNLNATEAQNQAKAYADTWVRWVEATDNTRETHVSVGSYDYRGGYYEFKAADPDKTTTNGNNGPITVNDVKWFDARVYTPMNPNNYYIQDDTGSWKDSTGQRQIEMFDAKNVVDALRFMSIATPRVFGTNTEPIVRDVDGKDVTGQGVMVGSPYYYTTTPQ